MIDVIKNAITQIIKPLQNTIKIFTSYNLATVFKINGQILINIYNSITSLLLTDQVDMYSPLYKTIIFDSMISAYVFVKEILIIKFIELQIVDANQHKNRNIIKDYKKEIIKKYNSVYFLNIIERYTVYFCVYYAINSFNYFIHINDTICNLALYILIIPSVQNKIFDTVFINNYRQKLSTSSEIFFKYYISKQFIKFIKILDNRIINIKTYNVFIVYNIVSVKLLIKMIKTFIFTGILYFLRGSDNKYYYYKAVKLACYYNFGYNFKVLKKDEAIDIVNNIIIYKKWREIDDYTNIHGIYVLCNEKYFKDIDYYDKYLKVIWFMTLWTYISFLKISSINVNLMMCSMYCIYKFIIEHKNFNDNIVLITILTVGMTLNINDIIITVFVFLNGVISDILNELLFFHKNYNNFQKAIIYYKDKVNGDSLDSNMFSKYQFNK